MDAADDVAHLLLFVLGHLALAIPRKEVGVVIADHRHQARRKAFPQLADFPIQESRAGLFPGQSLHRTVAGDEEQDGSFLILAVFHPAEIFLVRFHLFFQKGIDGFAFFLEIEHQIERAIAIGIDFPAIRLRTGDERLEIELAERNLSPCLRFFVRNVKLAVYIPEVGLDAVES